VAAFLFGSGFSALVYQTAWQKSFRLSFGASTAASAAVLAIFLGGLGLGGWLFGRRIERSARPLLFYGNLELAIALAAAASPVVGMGIRAVYLALGGVQTLGMVGATLVRLLGTALTIGPATLLMGGTLPAAARAVVVETDESRTRVALLYAANTLGAVVGALAGPLLLFELFGTRLTLLGAACVNLLVAVLARALGRAAEPIGVTENEVTTTLEGEPRQSPDSSPDRVFTGFVYATAAVVGFVFLGLELVWFRLLAPILGGSSLTFGLILASALSGIGAGSYVYSRRARTARASLELVAATLALEAVAVALPYAWGDELALVAAHLYPLRNLGFVYLVGAWIVVALAVVFPAAAVSGYQFPALLSLLGPGKTAVARQLGTAYAFNSIGSLFGSLVVGFLLLPTLGAVGAWRGAAYTLAALATGACVLAVLRGANARRGLVPAGFVAVALLLAATRGPGALFRHTAIGAGRLDVSALTPNDIRELARRFENDIVWQRDGVESTVGIDVTNGVSFIVNGKSDGSVVVDAGTQAWAGLLPAVLHGHAKNAFVVGLGTGMSAGLVARLPGIERVEVVELEPSVVEVARRSALANGDVLHNPRVELVFGDGRERLLTSRRTYDLVISEPSNPYRAGVAAFFTQEFYEAVRARMRQSALFMQWLQGYETDAIALATVLRTLRSVFPEVSLWASDNHDLMLIASLTPQVIDAERLRADLGRPEYRQWLERTWLTDGPEGIVAREIVTPAAMSALIARMPTAINTDDLNVLESRFARSVGDNSYQGVADILTAGVVDPGPRVRGTLDPERTAAYRARAGIRNRDGRDPPPSVLATIAGCQGRMERAGRLWPPDEAPHDPIETWVFAMTNALHGNAAAAATLADTLAASGFETEAWLVRSQSASAQRDERASVDALIAALEALRVRALPLCDVTMRAVRRAVELATHVPDRAPDILRALERPFAVYQGEFARRAAQATLATRLPDPKACLAGLGTYRERPAWNLELLVSRALCLRDAHADDADAAWQDVLSYLAEEPTTFTDRLTRFRTREGRAPTGGGEAEDTAAVDHP
jgi:spermidine synthase